VGTTPWPKAAEVLATITGSTSLMFAEPRSCSSTGTIRSTELGVLIVGRSALWTVTTGRVRGVPGESRDVAA